MWSLTVLAAPAVALHYATLAGMRGRALTACTLITQKLTPGDKHIQTELRPDMPLRRDSVVTKVARKRTMQRDTRTLRTVCCQMLRSLRSDSGFSRKSKAPTRILAIFCV